MAYEYDEFPSDFNYAQASESGVTRQILLQHEFHSEHESRTGDTPAWCSCGKFKPENDDWQDWVAHILEALKA